MGSRHRRDRWHWQGILRRACQKRYASESPAAAQSTHCHTTGINILLISRTEAKLKDTAAELESKHGIKTSYVAADLTACNDATWAAIQTAVDAVEVGLLINNAGASYHHADFTDRVDEKLVDDLIEMNMRALTKVGHEWWLLRRTCITLSLYNVNNDNLRCAEWRCVA